MSNKTTVKYVCPDCTKVFSLTRSRPGRDPYPMRKDVPKIENIKMCFSCRRKQDQLTVILEELYKNS